VPQNPHAFSKGGNVFGERLLKKKTKERGGERKKEGNNIGIIGGLKLKKKKPQWPRRAWGGRRKETGHKRETREKEKEKIEL